MMGEINKMVEIGRSGDCVALSFTRKYIYIYGGKGVGFTGSIRSAGVGGK